MTPLPPLRPALVAEWGGRQVRFPMIRPGFTLHGEPITNCLSDGALPPLDASDPRFCSGLDVVTVAMSPCVNCMTGFCVEHGTGLSDPGDET